MLNDLIEEIRKNLNKETRYVSNYMVERNLIGLFVLKYCYDKNRFNYEDLIKEENNKKITELVPEEALKILLSRLNELKVIKLFPRIQYENLKDLVKEYLDSSNIGINIINDTSKKICISSVLDTHLYDISGNTTYVIDRFDISKYDIEVFKFFDKVFEVNNEYKKYNDILFQDYNYLYIFDNTPRYRFIKDSNNDFYTLIRKILLDYSNLKIILHTNYRKISNIKESRMVIKFMSKILLFDDENSFIYYERKDNDKVSIINYDKISSLDKLFQIMKNDRKQKDILVKTTTDDIENNRYRIGFKLYENGIEQEARNINEIVDENTRLIDKLSRINKEIEQEINKLINR